MSRFPTVESRAQRAGNLSLSSLGYSKIIVNKQNQPFKAHAVVPDTQSDGRKSFL